MHVLRRLKLKGLGLVLLIAAVFGGSPVAAQFWLFPPLDPLEGAVVKEASAPEVYVIHDWKKIHIPTEDALFAMGHSWGSVRVMGDGELRRYPTVRIASSSPTPGSLVYPPDRVKKFSLRGVPGATRVVSRGKEIQLAELRGWLRTIDGGCGDGMDWHLGLEVDTDWAIEKGIDLNKILRVGNIAPPTVFQLPGFTPRRAVALPIVHIELDAFGRPEGENAPLPADWADNTFQAPCNLIFPFDLFEPTPGGPRLEPQRYDENKRHAYVRIVGSLVTDSPHESEAAIPTWFSRELAWTRNAADEWRGSVPSWSSRESSDREHPARWTEIHPPDLVEILPMKRSSVTTRGVALAARVGWLPFGLSNACEAVDFTMRPEGPRPAGYFLGYQELRGSETFWPWGQDRNNGSWITTFDDHIRVRARVCGGAIGGRPGLFKALYRVWWNPPLRNSGF